MNMLQVRIVNVDFCMQHPISGLDPLYSEFRGYTINQVPTIRVFGSTPTGLKTCLHVHGVFPYIYIPYEGQESADAVMYQVATSLDKAINISLGQTSSSTQHVFKISLVSGIPFYGFHAKNHQFLKIYFYKPFIVKKACVLLQAGNILGKVYQPHEAHIPYVLQFMMDYNLYGMSFINIEEFKYRFDQDNLTDISSDTILPPTVQRMSSSKLEIDVRAENILNKVEITSGELALNPGIKALWDDEKQRHRNRGDDSQIDHCLTQNRVDIKPTSTHLAFMSTLGEILAKPITEATNENANVSVYPAETPPDKIILNASSIEPIHSSQSSYSSFLDSTLTPDNLDEAIDHRTLDDQNLLDVLNDLRENIEDDSILSQATKKDDTDDESNEMILNEPLDAVQTPLKFVQRNVDEDCNDFDDSYFNATINIPQLDGCNEAEIYEPNRYSLRSRKCASAGIQNIEGKDDNGKCVSIGENRGRSDRIGEGSIRRSCAVGIRDSELEYNLTDASSSNKLGNCSVLVHVTGISEITSKKLRPSFTATETCTSEDVEETMTLETRKRTLKERSFWRKKSTFNRKRGNIKRKCSSTASSIMEETSKLHDVERTTMFRVVKPKRRSARELYGTIISRRSSRLSKLTDVENDSNSERNDNYVIATDLPDNKNDGFKFKIRKIPSSSSLHKGIEDATDVNTFEIVQNDVKSANFGLKFPAPVLDDTSIVTQNNSNRSDLKLIIRKVAATPRQERDVVDLVKVNDKKHSYKKNKSVATMFKKKKMKSNAKNTSTEHLYIRPLDFSDWDTESTVTQSNHYWKDHQYDESTATSQYCSTCTDTDDPNLRLTSSEDSPTSGEDITKIFPQTDDDCRYFNQVLHETSNNLLDKQKFDQPKGNQVCVDDLNNNENNFEIVPGQSSYNLRRGKRLCYKESLIPLYQFSYAGVAKNSRKKRKTWKNSDLHKSEYIFSGTDIEEEFQKCIVMSENNGRITTTESTETKKPLDATDGLFFEIDRKNEDVNVQKNKSSKNIDNEIETNTSLDESNSEQSRCYKSNQEMLTCTTNKTEEDNIKSYGESLLNFVYEPQNVDFCCVATKVESTGVANQNTEILELKKESKSLNTTSVQVQVLTEMLRTLESPLDSSFGIIDIHEEILNLREEKPSEKNCDNALAESNCEQKHTHKARLRKISNSISSTNEKNKGSKDDLVNWAIEEQTTDFNFMEVKSENLPNVNGEILELKKEKSTKCISLNSIKQIDIDSHPVNEYITKIETKCIQSTLDTSLFVVDNKKENESASLKNINSSKRSFKKSSFGQKYNHNANKSDAKMWKNVSNKDKESKYKSKKHKAKDKESNKNEPKNPRSSTSEHKSYSKNKSNSGNDKNKGDSKTLLSCKTSTKLQSEHKQNQENSCRKSLKSSAEILQPTLTNEQMNSGEERNISFDLFSNKNNQKNCKSSSLVVEKVHKERDRSKSQHKSHNAKSTHNEQKSTCKLSVSSLRKNQEKINPKDGSVPEKTTDNENEAKDSMDWYFSVRDVKGSNEKSNYKCKMQTDNKGKERPSTSSLKLSIDILHRNKAKSKSNTSDNKVKNTSEKNATMSSTPFLTTQPSQEISKLVHSSTSKSQAKPNSNKIGSKSIKYSERAKSSSSGIRKIKNKSPSKHISVMLKVPTLQHDKCTPKRNLKRQYHEQNFKSFTSSSPKFTIVEPNNRPYVLEDSYTEKKGSTIKYPNTHWTINSIEKALSELKVALAPNKKIVVQSDVVLKDDNKINVNNLSKGKTFTLAVNSSFPPNANCAAKSNCKPTVNEQASRDFRNFAELNKIEDGSKSETETQSNEKKDGSIITVPSSFNGEIQEFYVSEEFNKFQKHLEENKESNKSSLANQNIDTCEEYDDINLEFIFEDIRKSSDKQQKMIDKSKKLNGDPTVDQWLPGKSENRNKTSVQHIFEGTSMSNDKFLKEIDKSDRLNGNLLHNEWLPVKNQSSSHYIFSNCRLVESPAQRFHKILRRIEEKFNKLYTDIYRTVEHRTVSFRKILENHRKNAYNYILHNDAARSANSTILLKEQVSELQSCRKKSRIHKTFKTNEESNPNRRFSPDDSSCKSSRPLSIISTSSKDNNNATSYLSNGNKIVNIRNTTKSEDNNSAIYLSSVTKSVNIKKAKKSINENMQMCTKKNLFGFHLKQDVDERPRKRQKLHRGYIHQFNNIGQDFEYFQMGDYRNTASLRSNLELRDKVHDQLSETCDVNYPFNQYNFLDGPNDSSSEDEVQIVKPSKKRVKSSATEPIKYSQLNVKYTSPTKNKNSSSKSTREKIKERSSTLIKKDAATSSPSIPQLKHRRKLSFSEIHNLDSTRTEEILICKYTPKKSKTPEIIDKSESNAVSSQEIFSALQLCETEMNLTGEDKICNEQPDDGSPIPIIANPELNERNGTELDKTLTPNDKVISQKSDTSVQFSDDLFSPDIGLSIHSDQESDRIIIDKNPAEKYDAEHLFVPLAGTSKMDQSLQKLSLVSENSSKLTPHHANTIECGKESVYDQLNETCHIESSSSDQLTPYQLQQDRETGISQEIFHKIAEDTHNCSNLDVTRLSLHETRDDILPSENNICVIAPKYNPPSRAMVESSLKEYNIPAVRYQEPFYSNRADVTGNVEVGRNVLKIPSGNVADLPHFKTEFEGMNVLKKKMLQLLDPDGKLTKKQLLDFKLSTCKNVDVVMTPVRVPPTREQVEEWVQKQKTSTIDKNETKRKKRIFIPDSPGKEGEDSCDSLSISPCTPLDGDSTIFRLDEVTESVVASSNENSEKTSYEADIQSPVFKSKRKKNLKSNVIKNLPFSRLTGEETGTSESSVLSSNDTIFKNIRTDKSFNPHQLTGATFDNTNNFLVSGNNLQNAIAAKEYLYVTVVSMEVIVLTRNENKPNPELDTIQAIIYTVFNDVPEDDPRKLLTSGGFIVNSLPQSPTKIRLSIMDGICSKHNIKPVESELELINEFVNLVRDCDPDIFVGYEVETMSWGFLIDRGYVLNVNLISLLSRTPNAPVRKKSSDDVDIVITGRILIDFWRLLRHEIALQSYTFENVVYHILHERVPFYTHKELTHWLTQPTALYRHRVIEHYSFRCKAVLRMMEQLDLIGRTSELAKLFGIQFYEVLSRGSQFRVESMMLRLAKPLNYIPVTPNVQQRAKMRAPESLPLIMEPESKFYTDPVIVLDFQSLYPSMIIAYNYCFSTCLGRVEHLGQAHPFEFGATQLKVPRKYLRHFYKKDRINISPCGVAYVKKSVRLGILPRMLQEILDTRLMVKKSLKENADNKNLEKVLDARQLGLKLIANVTYGYTAANFSGRMPCIEVADSVVSKGRETLQRAITLVEKVTKWDARVVYGDTDSLFVLVKGRSREDAFKIGAEIAEVVTNDNPSPVKLKLEKVFQPCILQTKKRYVGYMYESATQSEPEFLAKGIETIRRDGCPAVSKMLEKCLKILFDTRDVSLVKKYVTRQLGKLLTGRISIQDLTFAKEYRGASNYRPGACVPALELVREWTKKDKRNEPRKKERVPYVIVNGPPRLPLIRLVRSPRDLLGDPSLRPNAIYYITKVIIPPINRCFLLLGADLKQWFNEMPRKQVQYLPTSSPTKSKVKKNTISQYFASLSCALCGVQTQDGMCASCKEKPQQSSILLHEKLRIWEKNHQETTLICQSCCGRSEDISCSSLDCPVYYRRIQTERDLQQSTFVRQLICSLPELEF